MGKSIYMINLLIRETSKGKIKKKIHYEDKITTFLN